MLLGVGLTLSICLIFSIGLLLFRENSPVAVGLDPNASFNVIEQTGSESINSSQVFFQYSHASIDDWIEWLKKEGSKFIRPATGMIIDYLGDNYDCNNNTVLDAVNSLAELGSKADTNILIKVLNHIDLNGRNYERSAKIYSAALRALIKLDPDLGVTVYRSEINNFISTPEYLEVSIPCLKYFAEEDCYIELWVEQLLNPRLDNRYKERLFFLLRNRSEWFYKKVFVQLVRDLIEMNKKVLDLGEEAIAYKILQVLIEDAVEDPLLWKLIFEAYASSRLHRIVKPLLIDQLTYPGFNLPIESLLYIALELDDNLELLKALAAKYGMDETLLDYFDEDKVLKMTKFSSEIFCEELIQPPSS